MCFGTNFKFLEHPKICMTFFVTCYCFHIYIFMYICIIILGFILARSTYMIYEFLATRIPPFLVHV